MAKNLESDNPIFQPIEKPEIGPANKIAKDIKPPAALKPGVDWDGIEVEITSEPLESPNPDWDSILNTWGYDPTIYEMVEPVKVSQWEVLTAEGDVRRLYSYKAGVRTRATVRDDTYIDLVREIRKYRKPKKEAPGGEQAMVVCIGDTQLGKGDGDGTQGTVNRILKAIDGVEERISELRKIGRNLGLLVVAGMGDMIEGCDGQYNSQTFTVELNRREQVRVCRRLIRDAIMRWAKYFPEVWVVAVPGNHGENRKNGRLYTDRGDNDDVAIFESIADIFSANQEAFGHVKFYIPENETSIVMDICGLPVGFTHGHIPSGSGSPQQKLRKWWGDQTFGNRPIGDAKILFSGHYHHLSVVEYGNDKIHIQCPSMEDISEWWADLKGEVSRPGVVTCVIDSNGYQDLQII